MTTVGELKAYIAKQEEKGHLTDDAAVLLGSHDRPDVYLDTMGIAIDTMRTGGRALWLSEQVIAEAHEVERDLT